jgi:hypothetical protein
VLACVSVHWRWRVLARVYPYLSSMHRAFAILSATSLTPPGFLILSYKRHDFRKKKFTEDKIQILFEAFLILRRIQHDVVINVKTSSYNFILFLSDIIKLEFSRQIFGKRSNTKFHQKPSSGSRVVPCGRTDGRTDARNMTKLIVAFHNFGKSLIK